MSRIQSDTSVQYPPGPEPIPLPPPDAAGAILRAAVALERAAAAITAHTAAITTLRQRVGVPAVAVHFNVSERTVRGWIAETPPVIPYCKIGGLLLFDLAECDLAINRRRITTAP